MKRMMIILFAIGMTAMSSTSMAAMSTGRVRQETRFLTDKMAHELDLNTAQYNDAYEINYDFIYAIRNTMDNVVRGEEWALNEYYYYLDIRNDDLRWVLDSQQYSRLMEIDYFYRPIYANTNGWSFRVYTTYSNHALFYFGLPTHYTTYSGAHFRTRNNNVSFYRGRYNHTVYKESHSVRDDKVYQNNRRSDFGRVKIRPNSNKRPDGRDKIYSTRPSNNTPSKDRNTRPSSPSNNKTHNVNSGNSNTRRENSGTIRRSNQNVKKDVDNSNRNNVRSERSNNNRSNATPASSGSRRNATETRSSSNGENRNAERSSSRSGKSNSSNARSNESTRGSAASKPTSNEPATKDKSSEKERSNSHTPRR
jgi:hypothetical protein